MRFPGFSHSFTTRTKSYPRNRRILDPKVGADTEFIARLAQKHGMVATKIPLGNYRVLGNSLTDKYWWDKRLAIDCVKENPLRPSRGESELTFRLYIVNKLDTI